jgi:hypothetical protein
VNAGFGIVLPDAHRPYHDERTHQLLCKFIAETKPQRGMIIGDWLNLAGISKHNFERVQIKATEPIDKDVESGNVGLDQIQKASPKTVWGFLEGNHEYRLVEFYYRHPEAGYSKFDIKKLLRLDDRGIRCVKYNDQKHPSRRIAWGKLQFIHGSLCGESHAVQMAKQSSSSIAYGHTHDMQMATKKADDLNKHVAFSCGHIMDERSRAADYIKLNTCWRKGFVTVVWDTDGTFQFQQHDLRKYKFHFDGHWWRG